MTNAMNTLQRNQVSVWIRILAAHLLIPVLLFACGWDLSWWQAWLFSVLLIVAGLGGRIWAEQRHPGYVGNILPLPGVALALGSVWTFIPATVALIVIFIRTVLEDRTLHEELPGYRDYAQSVRSRLMPGIF